MERKRPQLQFKQASELELSPRETHSYVNDIVRDNHIYGKPVKIMNIFFNIKK